MLEKNVVRKAVLAGAIAILSACGGGGGGGSGIPDNFNWNSQQTVSPADGSTGIALDVVVSISFANATIDCGTVTSTNYTLATAAGVAVAGSVACNNSAATFTPSAPLAPNTQYAVDIVDMKDSTGLYLASHTVWHFTTGSGAAGSDTYNIGGEISGLTGSGLVLRNNDGDDLARSADGSFTFATSLADHAGYQVTVRTQPTGQKCTVTNGTGSLSGADVTNVAVACATRSTTPIAHVYSKNYAYMTVHSVSAMAMDETGALSPLTPETVDTVGGPSGSAVVGSNLYVSASDSGLLRYTIGSDGALTPATAPVTVRPWAGGIAVHPSGNYAYVSSWDDGFGVNGQIDRYSIAADGTLTHAGVVASGTLITAMIEPLGRYAYTLEKNALNYTISAYAIAANGTWTFVSAFDSSWGTLAFDPDGQYAYLSGYQINSIFAISPNGSLTAAGNFDPGTTATSVLLTVDPSGKYAYASRYDDGYVMQYTVGADGSLTGNGSIWTYGYYLGAVQFDPSGKYAYVSIVKTGKRGFAQYTIDTHGNLIPMAVPFVIVNGGTGYAAGIVVVE